MARDRSIRVGCETHDAVELNHRSIACTLDEPPIVERNRWIDQVAAQGPKPRRRPLFIGAREPGKNQRSMAATLRATTTSPLPCRC